MLRAQLLATLLALWLAATQLLKSEDDLLGVRAVLYKLVVLAAWVGNERLLPFLYLFQQISDLWV